MVTYAAPIYAGDQHVGLLAADITLAFLERFVEQFAGPPGRFIIATGGGQVLADSGGASRGEALSLADVLPAGLSGEAADVLDGKRSFSSPVDGTYVYSRQLDAAPWVFVHLLRESDLASHISPTRTTYGIALLLFSSFLLLTWFALRHRAAEAALGRSEMRYREIFNATGDAIFIHDTGSGAIVDVNSTMLDLYGYTREEALKLQVGDLSASDPPWSQKEAQRLIRRAVEGEPQVFEWRAKKKGGELFWVEVALSSSVIAGRGRVLAVVRDITERRRLEKENLEVRDQVIQEMKYHEDYVSEIAHRLRNPLQLLMGHLEFFESSNLSAEQKSALKAIRESLVKIGEGIKKLT
jgi:PAS domain S-box-containing protein